jgi:hypothetical protein
MKALNEGDLRAGYKATAVEEYHIMRPLLEAGYSTAFANVAGKTAWGFIYLSLNRTATTIGQVVGDHAQRQARSEARGQTPRGFIGKATAGAFGPAPLPAY